MFRPLVLAALLAFAVAPVAASAADKPTLTVYTYDAFAADWGPGPGLKQGFEKTCACTLDFVAADSSIGALRRVQLEGRTTRADIVLGLDTALAGTAEATGLFAPHGIDTTALKVPNGWSSPDFVPFDYGYFAFVYDKTKLADPPHSFKDLAGADGLTIVIEDPRSATPGLGLVLWIEAAYGDKAPSVWSGLAPHVVTVTPDWSSAYDLFLKGEADMVLSYTTSPAYHLVEEQNDRYAAAAFDEGHYLQVEIAGILQSSPHKDLAGKFLAYLVSPEAQALIPHTNWMYPVADGPVPDGFAGLVAPDPVLLLPDAEVAAHSGDWIAEALDALAGK